jgi:branched-chain amino acid transport system substrate-binding protein
MMNIMRNRFGIGVLFFLLVAAIFSFGDAFGQASPKKTVKIGCSLPLNISFGAEIKVALDLAVDMVNRDGGITVGKEAYKVEMVIYDNKYKPEPAIAATQRLINIDKVKGLVADTGAASILASIPIAQQSGLPMLCSSHSDRVVDPRYKYVYIVSTARSVDILYPLLLKARPDIKTAVIAAQDDETGRDMTRRAQIILGQRGVKVLDSFFFPRDMRDYTPVSTKVASLKPDVFAIPGMGGAAEKMGLMSKALYDTNWRGVTFVTAAPVVKDLANICPRGEAEGLYIPLGDFTELPNAPPLAVKMRKAFEQKHGEWRESGASWTMPFWFWVAAVQKAGSFEAAQIDKALAGLEVETPIGMAKMIKRPDLNNPKYVDTMVTPALAQVKGNKGVHIASMTTRDAIRELEKTYGFKGQWE